MNDQWILEVQLLYHEQAMIKAITPTKMTRDNIIISQFHLTYFNSNFFQAKRHIAKTLQ